jgi:radical SAM superfamily enzyme YgiQ (UPF0313 family)
MSAPGDWSDADLMWGARVTGVGTVTPSMSKSGTEKGAARYLDADNTLSALFPNRRIERVLLVTPPDVDASLFSYETCKRGRYSNYPPYGLMTLASGLRSIGIDVRLVNLNNAVLRSARQSSSKESFDFEDAWRCELDAALAEGAFDLFGVTCMFTQTHDSFRAVCDRMHTLASSVPIAVGGVHVTNAMASPAAAARFQADLASAKLFFAYEADVAFTQFVEVVSRTRPVQDLCQLSIHHDGDFISFPERVTPEGDALNRLPSHDLMPPATLSRWGKVGAYSFMRGEEDVFSTVLSNRGCRAQCTFCSVRNFNGVGVRRRSIQSVIDELLMLRYHYDVRHIMWLDDDFLYDRAASMNLLNEMVRQNVDLTWDCTNGVLAASCTDELISAAADSGCLGLNIGMESGNPEVLRKIRKPASVNTLLKAAETLRRYPQIFSRVFLIIGFPHETFRQMQDTLEVSAEMALDWYQIQVLQPLPNTPIFDQMLEEGLLDTSEFKDVRYSGGTYGRAAKVTESGRDMLDRDFKNVFQESKESEVVPKRLFESVWAYMTFHLNYLGIPEETREIKLRQYQKYLGHITRVIAPNDALAYYFLGHVQGRLNGAVDTGLVSQLGALLEDSPFWGERFLEFGLSIGDLETVRALSTRGTPVATVEPTV